MSSATPLPSYSSYEFMLVSSPSPFVAHLEINRPKKLNAFTPAVWAEFGRVFRQISADPDVRVVVLSGAGDRAFTAGLDVQSASEGFLSAQASDPARRAKPLRAHIEDFQDNISAMEKCEKRELSLHLLRVRCLVLRESVLTCQFCLQLSFVSSMILLLAWPSTLPAAPTSAYVRPTCACLSRR
jgi:hypothetical protein